MRAIETAKGYSLPRLAELSADLSKYDFEASRLRSLAVYVCGSYGRLEANQHSDIDPFFVNTNSPALPEGEQYRTNLLSVDVVCFWAHFVQTLNRHGFKQLTGGGQYLKVHELHDMRKNLGGPQDDALNEFTARMLLLLESRPLCNVGAYESLVDAVIGFYYEDYHDHVKDFRPVFLLNDILRYWKTMCLNYEHARRLKVVQQAGESPDELAARKAQVHLKNLKLKFSRLLICYSMIIRLATPKEVHDKASIRQLVGVSPIERIRSLDGPANVIDDILQDYDFFLELVARTDILKLIGDKDTRNKQFERARHFSEKVYTLLLNTADKTILRLITI